ncbi:MAG: VWA domain-containing protein [Lysobacterales bacterium]
MLIANPWIWAQGATLDAPAQATIGSTIEVRWSGPGEQYDSIAVTVPNAADADQAINSASITSGKNPVPLVMPETPGSYQLRYISRASKAVIGRASIKAVDVETRLGAPERAQAGAAIEIEWTGPGNSYEQIQLFAMGAPADAKPLAQATVLGRSPLRMHLPETTGEFELRYLTRLSKRILARRPITLFGVNATLQAPEVAAIGETIEITWEGPGNQYDQLTLYRVGEDKPAKVERIVSRQNPVPMQLPEQSGAYELRYQTARDGAVLATRPLRIGKVDADLDAPTQATAGTLIEVRWTGPGNNYDSIGVYRPGDADDAKAQSHVAILNQKNPADLKLPAIDGDFELRYRTRQSAAVLARRPIRIEPAGRLSVVYEGQGGHSGATMGTGAVELILDASGSMLQRIDGQRRIEIARSVLDDLVRTQLPEGTAFALRVFGHKAADQCRTDLEIPLGRLDRDAAASRIAGVNAMNLAKTPIADSLAKVSADLAAAKGPKTVVLITDGEETCEGDPARAIKELRDKGLDVQVSIVGFAIDDAELKNSFRTWAELGGGSYFDAGSAAELLRSLRTVISGPYKVLDGSGRVVARGIIGGAEIILPAGNYRIETVATPVQAIESVTVKSGELAEARF